MPEFSLPTRRDCALSVEAQSEYSNFVSTLQLRAPRPVVLGPPAAIRGRGDTIPGISEDWAPEAGSEIESWTGAT